MAKINNPFVVYGYKGAAYFCDRKQETEKMMQTLHGERNITLIAPRRMGKTGLIHHVFEQVAAAEPDTRCFYVDIFATKNLEQLVNLLANTVIGQLDTFSQATMRRVQEFFCSWRPTVTFDQLTGLPTISLDIRPSEGKESLRQVFAYIQQSGRRCYIAIDEFQQILSYPETGVEALIRSYIQFLPNAYFIFSGSQQHMMQQMFLSANRPFFQSSMVMTLQSIAPIEYLDFANGFLSPQGRSLPLEVLAHIYELTEGITWYIQAILHGIYEQREAPITRKLVAEVVSELLDEQAATYQNYCSWLTENQLALLRAIAREGEVASPFSQPFQRSHNLPATSSIKTALRALEEKQLVHKSPAGYKVSDRFFSLWLKRP